MFAVLDVNQITQKKRLVTFRLLGQLFNILKLELLEVKAVDINYKSSNQLDLSLRYFIQHYPDHSKISKTQENFRRSTNLSNLKKK